MTHFEVNHDITLTNNSNAKTIEHLEQLIGGHVFWIDEDEFGGRKDHTNFTGKINQDGSITVEFD